MPQSPFLAVYQIETDDIAGLMQALQNGSYQMRLAAKFNTAHAFDDVNDLVRSSEVDLVVISVKVPLHKELTAKAIKAGKHVYCEWPLGNGLVEALEMQELAEKQRIQAFVGLQSQTVPSISFVKDLVKDGYVGKVLSTSIVAFGGMLATDEANAYTLDVKKEQVCLPFRLAQQFMQYAIVWATLHGLQPLPPQSMNMAL